MIFGKLENNQFVEYDFIKLENGGIIQTQEENVWFENGYKLYADKLLGVDSGRKFWLNIFCPFNAAKINIIKINVLI